MQKNPEWYHSCPKSSVRKQCSVSSASLLTPPLLDHLPPLNFPSSSTFRSVHSYPLISFQYRNEFEGERNSDMFWSTVFPHSTADFVLELAKFWPKMTWHLPLALFCISLSWWENYVDAWIIPQRVATALANLKYRLKKKRSNVNFLSRLVIWWIMQGWCWVDALGWKWGVRNMIYGYLDDVEVSHAN